MQQSETGETGSQKKMCVFACVCVCAHVCACQRGFIFASVSLYMNVFPVEMGQCNALFSSLNCRFVMEIATSPPTRRSLHLTLCITWVASMWRTILRPQQMTSSGTGECKLCLRWVYVATWSANRIASTLWGEVVSLHSISHAFNCIT